MKILLDTSVIIDHFRMKNNLLPSLVEQAEQEKIEIILSSIVLFELWRGLSMKSATIRNDMESFLSRFSVISVDAAIATSAGDIERNGFSHGNDALIAACCLQERAKLATLNPNDFSRVPRLSLWKP